MRCCSRISIRVSFNVDDEVRCWWRPDNNVNVLIGRDLSWFYKRFSAENGPNINIGCVSVQFDLDIFEIV